MSARYYASPPVNQADASGRQFTANIYLAGAANVGAYSVELVVNGNPENVTYIYTAAAVSGFTAVAGQGIGGFSTASGGSFSESGRLLGSVTVSFSVAPAAPFKLAQSRWSLDDMSYVAIPVSWDVFANSITAPSITSGASASVAENSAPSTLLYRAVASDPDAGDSITWSMSGTDAGLLSMDSSGQVRLKAAANFEAKSSYSFDAVATDSAGLVASKAVVLNVSDVNDAPTGSVTISGTPTQDQTLTATNTLADDDGLGTVSYQWKAGDVSISGATSSTYLLTQAEVGKTVTLTASYTDAFSTAESVPSSATTAVANVNDAPTGSVTISGTPTQGQTLTATNTLADVDGLGTISYQWKAGDVSITGATSSTYVLTQAEVGKTVTVTASYTDALSTAESKTSSATEAVANVNDAPTGSVTISGTPTQGQTLTATNTLADDDGLGTVSYQWKAGDVSISAATSSTYVLTQAEVGKTVTATASYTDALSTAESKTSSATTAVANVNDAPTGSVTISGTPTQGQTLTAANTLADVDGIPASGVAGALSYQWEAGNVSISGATSSTYVLTQAEVGKLITVTASYTDAFSTAESKTSSATTAVISIDTLAPTVATFSPAVEATNTAINANIVLTFSEAIALGTGSIVLKTSAGVTVDAYNAATSANLSISGAVLTINPAADLGYATGYAVEFSAGSIKDLVGNSYAGTTSYNFTTGSRSNTLPTGSVTLSGTSTQGQTLTAAKTLADLDGLGAISYQWSSGGVAISGATSSTYVLTQAEVGKTVTVTASYTDAFNTAESKTSSATEAVANVNDAPTGSVTISGTPTQGQTLTAANTLADLDGLGTISYQWSAGGLAISGATSSTYVLTQAEVGNTVTATASYTDAGGTAESKASSATTAVANVNDAPTGAVTISGTPTQGQTLTATNTLADVDGLGALSYQWQAGDVSITGATSSTYVLTQAEVGKLITVTASYTDAFSTAESKASSATEAVANVNDAPSGSVTISGTPTQGQTLTATNTLADVDGLGAISYQWKAGDVSITGATSSTYVLTQAEVGKLITVTASYTDAFSTAESKASSATEAVANVNDAPSGSVTISGTPTQGQTLTATNTLADVDGLGAISYQWKAGDVSISGATNSTYVLTQAEVGKAVTVTASYTDAFSTAESKTSSATAAVISIDTLAPTVATFSPADKATNTAINANIVLTFSEAIALGTGNIVLKTAAGVTVATYSAATSTNLSISDSTLTINPTADLGYSTGYKVEFAAGTIKDIAGNSYAGVTDYNFTTAAANAAGKTADITAYSWKAHTLLSGVSLNAASTNLTSDSKGTASFTAVTESSLSLTASRAIPSAEATATSAAVNLQDAIAILKMIVGLEVNGTGKALSPYQALAADYDGNGSVQLTDAIGVLKHVVGLPTSTPTWRFVNELDTTVPSKTTLSPGAAQTSITASLSASSPVKVGLVGYLTGDVDGSYAGATGALDLDITQPSYFTALVTPNSGLSLAQFGVY